MTGLHERHITDRARIPSLGTFVHWSARSGGGLGTWLGLVRKVTNCSNSFRVGAMGGMVTQGSPETFGATHGLSD